MFCLSCAIVIFLKLFSNMKTAICVCLLVTSVLFGKISCAQTIISGIINTDVTWTLEQSPYLVASNVLIGPNAVVTIEPGVTIRFSEGTEILLRGRIEAVGSVQDSIYFIPNGTSTNTNLHYWEGIRFDNTVGASIKLKYVYASDAEIFIDLTSANGTDTILDFNHCKLFNHNRAISANDITKSYSARIDHCNFTEIEGYVIFGSSNFRVSNSFFNGNFRVSYNGASQDAIFENCVFTGSYDAALIITGTIRNCEFYGNSRGFATQGNGPIAENNYIHDNDIGISLSNYGTITLENKIQFNTICNNVINARISQNASTAYLSNNCWCGLDSVSVANSTIDFFEEANLGFIEFMPLLDNCDIILSEPSSSESFQISSLVNPSSDHISFKINSPNNEDVTISCISMEGRMYILEKNRPVSPGLTSCTIDASILSPGIYILTVAGRSKQIRRKIVRL